MIGLDTNVLVRYLVQDDVQQAARASKHIEGAAAAGERCFVGTVVLCELLWVLDSAYGFEKPLLVDVLEKILMAAQLEVEDKDAAWSALADFRDRGVDFADCLIGRSNRARGCEATVTFDKALSKMDGFRTL